MLLSQKKMQVFLLNLAMQILRAYPKVLIAIFGQALLKSESCTCPA